MPTATKIDVRKVDEKLRRGDPISDEELRAGLKRFRAIQESLQDLGPRWDFAWKEALRLGDMCEEYLRARKRFKQTG